MLIFWKHERINFFKRRNFYTLYNPIIAFWSCRFLVITLSCKKTGLIINIQNVKLFQVLILVGRIFETGTECKNILQIHGVRTMDTFWIIKSLTNHLLSIFPIHFAPMTGQTNNLICWQSLSPGLHLISSRNDHGEINWCSRQTELVPFHFPFISIQLCSEREQWSSTVIGQ